MVEILASYWWVLVIVLLIALNKFVLRLFGVIRIPEDRMGLINKKFLLMSRLKLPAGHIVALNGEAGYQADTLAPGLYFGFWPWQYSVELIPFTVVPTGKILLVSAKDGETMPGNRILGKKVECNNYQDARAFLTSGGQKGKQSHIILAGVYRINTLLFDLTEDVVKVIPKDKVGIVTTNDGIPLIKGEIAANIIDGHDNFQDFDAFIEKGGSRGLQQQVVLSGSWNLNPWAVSVEIQDMVNIDIGYVGVINSYVGPEGVDTSGANFQHGNIVSKGQKGVWAEVLSPGKYAINPYIMKVEIVPTTNLVLNWADSRTESHKLDENLSTIKVRSKDGFTFNLDVSQIIHVPYTEAPKVIARFGTIKNLVSQVLEPTIGNYFRNSAQNSDVIQFLVARSDRQKEAKEHISNVLKEYNVNAVDTLIGDITPPPDLMLTLTNRKIADENKATYQSQQAAQAVRQELTKATALADIQGKVVESEQGIQISQNQATAVAKKAEGDANAVKLNASAEAERIKLTGDAEAGKIAAVGKATATAYELQVKAMGQDNFTKFSVTKAVADGHVKIMPDTLIQGGSGAGVMDAILANFLMVQTNGIQTHVSPAK